MSLDQFASAGESKQARRLVSRILTFGYSISIDDGEEITVRHSRNRKELYPAMCTTGEDRLLIHDSTGKHIGTFWLVYGNAANGEELIADHTGNDICDAIAEYVDEGLR